MLGLGRRGFLLVALTLVAAALPVLTRPDHVFWTVDQGNKLLLANSFLEQPAEYFSGRSTRERLIRPELPYPSRGFDPEAKFAPIGPPFAHLRDGRLLSQYPPAFSLLSAIPIRLFGEGGAFVVPLLGMALLLVLIGRAAKALGVAPEPAMFFMGLGGPLLFYAGTFWEHTLASLGVALAALLGFRRLETPMQATPSTRRIPVSAGFVLGLVGWVREDVLLIFAAVILAFSFTGNRRRHVPYWMVGFAVSFLPFVAAQTISTGSLVFRAESNLGGVFEHGVGGFLSERLLVIRGLLLSTGSASRAAAWLSTAIGAGAILTWFGPRVYRRARQTRKNTMPVGDVVAKVGIVLVAVLSVWVVVGLVFSDSIWFTLMEANGLLVFAPWVLLLGYRDSSDPECIRTMRTVIFVAIVLFLLATPLATVQGIHWGPRILLSLFPLIAIYAASVVALRYREWPVRVLLVASLIIGLAGPVALHRGRARVGEMAASIETVVSRGAPDLPIVTHIWWYAQMFPETYMTRPIYRVGSPDALRDWIVRYRTSGGGEFLWASNAPHDSILEGLPVRLLGSNHIECAGLSHRLVRLRILAPGEPLGR